MNNTNVNLNDRIDGSKQVSDKIKEKKGLEELLIKDLILK